MIYTILELKDIQSDLSVNLDSKGNAYTIGLYNHITKEYTHKDFFDIESALKVFNIFTEIFAKGLYSYEDRKAILS